MYAGVRVIYIQLAAQAAAGLILPRELSKRAVLLDVTLLWLIVAGGACHDHAGGQDVCCV